MTAEEFIQAMQPPCDMTYQPFRARIHAGARTMSDFAAFLSRLPDPGGLVVDRTGWGGAYDFELNFARGGATAAQDNAAPLPDHQHPTLMLALEEQLGLRLERTRGAVAVLVVEHVEMPDAN